MDDRPPAGPLLARTRRLDRAVDFVAHATGGPGRGDGGALFVRDGVGLAGQGVAGRIPLVEAGEMLAAIEVDDDLARPGSGAVAFGALPFVPGEPSELVVPRLVVARSEDGTRWVTAIGPPDAVPDDPNDAIDALDPSGPTQPGTEPFWPSELTITSSRPPEDWCDAVAVATKRIRDGVLDKVVLAREVVVTADAELVPGPLLARLRRSYPGCFLYLLDGYLGASPELLVSRQGDMVRAQPMAGTTARRGDPQADARAAAALLADPSYRREHQVTIDVVHDTLLPFCSYLDDEAEPSVVALANVAHLATSVEGRLSHPAASVLELVRALHPTPAVCGRPRQAALDLIAELEQLERGRYAGAVGWVDDRGNGSWAVAIRGAQLEGRTARVIAGNGLVGDSDPEAELAETRAKLQAVLSALVRV